MTDFDYEVLERKRLAQQAKHRKNGSRSKKCTLPCDYMTEAQKKGMNGPMVSYDLGHPTTYNEFKYWPEDVQREYLETLWKTFGASQANVAKMLGIHRTTLNSYMTRHNLLDAIPTKQGYKMPQDKKRFWESFVAEKRSISQLRAEMSEEEVFEPGQEVVEEKAPAPVGMPVKCVPAIAEAPCETNVATKIELAFPGDMDISQLAAMLEKALSSYDVQEYRITCQCCLKL